MLYKCLELLETFLYLFFSIFLMVHIDSFRFGDIVVDGKSYQDIKIHKDKIIEWRYKKHHTVLKEDIEEISDDVEIIIIGTGDPGYVKVDNSALKFAEDNGIELIIETTKEACRSFNSLVGKKKIAAILHSTC